MLWEVSCRPAPETSKFLPLDKAKRQRLAEIVKGRFEGVCRVERITGGGVATAPTKNDRVAFRLRNQRADFAAPTMRPVLAVQMFKNHFIIHCLTFLLMPFS